MAKIPDIEVNIVAEGLERLVGTARIIGVLGEVTEEIWSAREKHGNQNHAPLGFGDTDPINDPLDSGLYLARNTDQLERLAKERCDEAFAAGRGTWEHIVTEEWAEACNAESETLRDELVQLAAMSVAAIIALDSQNDS